MLPVLAATNGIARYTMYTVHCVSIETHDILLYSILYYGSSVATLGTFKTVPGHTGMKICLTFQFKGGFESSQTVPLKKQGVFRAIVANY